VVVDVSVAVVAEVVASVWVVEEVVVSVSVWVSVVVSVAGGAVDVLGGSVSVSVGLGDREAVWLGSREGTVGTETPSPDERLIDGRLVGRLTSPSQAVRTSGMRSRTLNVRRDQGVPFMAHPKLADGLERPRHPHRMTCPTSPVGFTRPG
jgi:hypothetical protein